MSKENLKSNYQIPSSVARKIVFYNKTVCPNQCLQTDCQFQNLYLKVQLMKANNHMIPSNKQVITIILSLTNFL